jgi:chromosome segregation ATPase
MQDGEQKDGVTAIEVELPSPTEERLRQTAEHVVSHPPFTKDETKATPPVNLEALVDEAIDKRFNKFRSEVSGDINAAIDKAVATLKEEWDGIFSKLKVGMQREATASIDDAVKQIRQDAQNRVSQIVGDGRTAVKGMTATGEKYRKHIELAGDRLVAFDGKMAELKSAVDGLRATSIETSASLVALNERCDQIDQQIADLWKGIGESKKTSESARRQLKSLQEAVNKASTK